MDMDYEGILKAVGSYGPFQKRLAATAFFVAMAGAWPTLMLPLVQYAPNIHCISPRMGQSNENGSIVSTAFNTTWESLGEWSEEYCGIFGSAKNATSADAENASKSARSCPNGWAFDDNNTVLAEWNLVCENAWKDPLAVMMFMAGVAAGSCSGKLCDVFGRRPMLLIAMFGQFVAMGLVGFSWDFAWYTFFLFVVGFMSLVCYETAFVLATESIGADRQFEMAMFYALAYAVGYMISPLFAYLFPFWRWFMLTNALAGAFVIPICWFCPESIPWLLLRGKENEAKSLLRRIAKSNHREVDVDSLYESFQHSKERKLVYTAAEDGIRQRESSYLIMLKNRTMFLRSCALYLGWGVASMVYYAITLNPSTLAGDRLLNIFLSGLVEIPAVVVAYFSVRVIGRIRATSAFYIIAGVSCCTAPLLFGAAPAVVTLLVLVGKWSISAAFSIIYVLVPEVTPTLVRTTSIGVASFSARIGAIIMPYLMYAGKTVTPAMPFLVMGMITLLTGLVLLMIVPETKDLPMPDTIEDALRNKRIYGLKIWRKFPKQQREISAGDLKVMDCDRPDSSSRFSREPQLYSDAVQ